MTGVTAVADDITIMFQNEDDGVKVVVHFVNSATFIVRKGAYLKLVFERPVAFKVVQG